MKVIALIPARSGSKRLPGKNVRDFHGKPLLEKSIRAASEAKLIYEVYVSTDDNDLGNIATSLGARYLPRPAEFARDLSSTSEVLLHASTFLNLTDEDLIVTLQPTNPFRPVGILDKIIAFATAQSVQWDSLTTVSPVKLKIGQIRENKYHPFNYHQGQRSQDMEEKFFFENGLAYITKVKTLSEQQNMFGNEILAYKTELEYSEIDIDTLKDFEVAQALYLDLKDKYQLI